MNYAYCTGVMTAKINFLANMLCAKGLIDYADYDEVKAMCEDIVTESEQAAKAYAEGKLS